jgi:hypothetical protein
MPTPTEYIKLYGTKMRETEKAIHFTVDFVGTKEIEPVTHWFPISQIKSMTIGEPDRVDEDDMIEVAEWICRSKELV